jgi:ketosteroid isomerase-like protein
MATLSARFVRALRALENELDLQPLVQLYVDDCEVSSPLFNEPLLGIEAVRRYWRQYLDSFQMVRTEFTVMVDGQNASALEWISSATAPDGRPLEFSGVTLLLTTDARITSMHVYCDPRPLLGLAQVLREPTPIRASLNNARSA